MMLSLHPLRLLCKLLTIFFVSANEVTTLDNQQRINLCHERLALTSNLTYFGMCGNECYYK
jgi:hypothetical protein